MQDKNCSSVFSLFFNIFLFLSDRFSLSLILCLSPSSINSSIVVFCLHFFSLFIVCIHASKTKYWRVLIQVHNAEWHVQTNEMTTWNTQTRHLNLFFVVHDLSQLCLYWFRTGFRYNFSWCMHEFRLSQTLYSLFCLSEYGLFVFWFNITKLKDENNIYFIDNFTVVKPLSFGRFFFTSISFVSTPVKSSCHYNKKVKKKRTKR